MNSPRQGNLTGNPRKVKDTGADLYNISQLWRAYKDEGVGFIKQITNTKLRWFEEKEKRKEIEATLQELCDKLESSHQKLEKLVQKLETLSSHMEGISKLEEYQLKNKIGRFATSEESDIMFLTWPSHRFYETCNEIAKYHREEVEAKKIICENVAHSSTKDELIFYTAAWAHDPLIPERCAFLIESFLCETGHR